MGNLRDEDKLRQIRPTDVVLGADENGCLVNFPPDNFSGSIPISIDTETGDGEELFTEPNVNDFLFKKLKSSDNSADVTTDTDGNIDLSVSDEWVKNLISEPWFATLVRNLFVSGEINICTLIEDCPVNINNQPTMTGDVVYNLSNRTLNFPLDYEDFESKYYDIEGETLVSIKIIGGDLSGITKLNGQPLALNDIIPIGEVSSMTYTGPDTNEFRSQLVQYVGINSAGQFTN